jgi:23S rRNA pseudouridine2605 synthase
MTQDDAAATPPREGERIAKVLARAGVCSRRDAERLIAEGRVTVDGTVLTSPALNVTVANRIEVDGKPVGAPEPTRLWRYYKPRGLVVSAKDEKGRPTVFDALKGKLPRVVSVGRLDLNSEGLLLLTNDGALERRLELPSTGWVRRYRVRVFGAVDPVRLMALSKGVTVDGVTYGAIEVDIERAQGANTWLSVGLKEGKNREIRRVMEHVGLTVNRLIRVAYGPFNVGGLEPGDVAPVPRRELEAALAGEEIARAPKPPGQKPTPPPRPDGRRAGGDARIDGPRSERPREDRPKGARPKDDMPRGEGPRDAAQKRPRPAGAKGAWSGAGPGRGPKPDRPRPAGGPGRADRRR